MSKKKRKSKFYYWIYNVYRHQIECSKKRGHQPPEYSKEELENWVKLQPNFEELFKNWKQSGYNTKLIPSIDRLDDYKTYSFENIQLTTWGENNLKACIKNNLKLSRKICQIDISNLNLINTFDSISEASRKTGIIRTNINACCKGRVKTAGGFKWKYYEGN